MSFIPVVKYCFGLGVFGFVYWLLDGILGRIVEEGVHITSVAWSIMQILWLLMVIVYLVFGGWWLIRSYDESQYQQGGW